VLIFTPYLEMAHLRTTTSRSSRCTRRRRTGSTDAEIKKLLTQVKVFVVNPQPACRGALDRHDQEDRSGAQEAADLILLTDDVYGTFVPGFRSLIGEFPKNTIAHRTANTSAALVGAWARLRSTRTTSSTR
jgi:aspartate 4-decarboxylase